MQNEVKPIEIIESIRNREVVEVQHGVSSWYEVRIAIRFDGEVAEHEYPIIAASSYRAAVKIGRVRARSMRKYNGTDAVFASVRKLAYRGDLHPDRDEYTVREAGYARAR